MAPANISEALALLPSTNTANGTVIEYQADDVNDSDNQLEAAVEYVKSQIK